MPALAAELEAQRRAPHLHVPIAHRRHADRAVVARVLFVADANRASSRAAGRRRRGPSRAADRSCAGRHALRLRMRGSAAREREEASVFHLVAHHSPFGVVAILLAAARIAAGRLQNVHAGPRKSTRRSRPAAIASALIRARSALLVNRRPSALTISEMLRASDATDARAAIGDVAQARRFRGFGGRQIAVRPHLSASHVMQHAMCLPLVGIQPAPRERQSRTSPRIRIQQSAAACDELGERRNITPCFERLR